MLKISCAGKSDLGFGRNVNEDFIYMKNLEDDVTLVIVADGSGSSGSEFQPASIAALEISTILSRLYEENKKLFLENPELFIKEAMLSAGRILGVFRTANEELYNGYASSCDVGLFYDGKLTFAHTGNTRINLIRRNKKTGEPKITQLTKDQTKGQELVDQGKLDVISYHISSERLQITGGLGVASEPLIQTFTMNLRENDFFFFTTDGIHYAIRPEIIFEILTRSESLDECIDSMIMAAKQEEYADNMSAMLVWAVPGELLEAENNKAMNNKTEE